MQRKDNGFSLVELLVTIIILGILATVAVFAVRNLTDNAQTSSCATERRQLDTAEEIHRTQNGSYATEAQLVSGGQLKSPSSMYDVTLAGGSYTLAAVGDCATTSSTGSTSTPPPGPSALTALNSGSPIVTIPGIPNVYRYDGAVSAPVVVFVGFGVGTPGVGYEAAAAQWNLRTSNPPPITHSLEIWDTSLWGNSILSTDIGGASLPSSYRVIIFDSALLTTDTSENAGDLVGSLLTSSGADVCHTASPGGVVGCFAGFGL